MQLDSLTNFIAPGSTPVSAVGAAGATIALGAPLDLLGSGVGTAPANIIGNTSVFGVDPGIGRIRPDIQINIGTAFATGNAATATFALQYAADQGAAGGYQPSTWYTSSETNAHAVGALPANTVIRMDITPAPPEVPTPRYVRLILYPPAATNMSAGTITFAGLTMMRDDQVNRQAAGNYTVA